MSSSPNATIKEFHEKASTHGRRGRARSSGVQRRRRRETWRIGLEEIEGSVQHRYAEQFKELVEEQSDGDITVQLLPYGTWGSTYSSLYDAVQGGAIQMGFGSGALGGTVPESQLLNLNFIMPADQLETTKVLNSDAFLKSEAWQQAFRQRDLVPLAELPEGYQVWTANKAIRAPADMKGVNIRVMDNSLLRSTYNAYGATPPPSPTASSTAPCSKARRTPTFSRCSPTRKWASTKCRAT